MEPRAWRVASKTMGKKAATVLGTLTTSKTGEKEAIFGNCTHNYLACSWSWEGAM